MPFKPAICPQCGAQLKVDPSKDAAVCQYCGTPFIIEKAINNYNQRNTFILGEGATVIMSADQEKEISAAFGHLQLGRFDTAYTQFTELSNKYPTDFRTWLGRVQAYTHNYTNFDCTIHEQGDPKSLAKEPQWYYEKYLKQINEWKGYIKKTCKDKQICIDAMTSIDTYLSELKTNYQALDQSFEDQCHDVYSAFLSHLNELNSEIYTITTNYKTKLDNAVILRQKQRESKGYMSGSEYRACQIIFYAISIFTISSFDKHLRTSSNMTDEKYFPSIIGFSLLMLITAGLLSWLIKKIVDYRCHSTSLQIYYKWKQSCDIAKTYLHSSAKSFYAHKEKVLDELMNAINIISQNHKTSESIVRGRILKGHDVSDDASLEKLLLQIENAKIPTSDILRQYNEEDIDYHV